MKPSDVLKDVVALCERAGQAILEVYHRTDGFDVETKDDNSPVTEADLAAHEILHRGLGALLEDVPILSEESSVPDYELRRQWQRYWIVDPLDGTKEFIRRNGEFTVNVALIDGGAPILGVVYVPVSDVVYTGVKGEGASKREEGIWRPIQVRTVGSRTEQKLPIEVVASRRHGADEVDRLLANIAGELGSTATKSMGSSLKLCLVAEGQADLYPRLAPTSEWDTAAAQAVVEAAGGAVLNPDFLPLRYNGKADILNPHFYVVGDVDYDWCALLNVAS